MSFSGLLTAVAEYVGATLVDDCGRPAPTRVLRYHGGALPQDCCTADGILSVGWVSEFPTATWPAGWRGGFEPPPGPFTADLWVRYDTCWLVPAANAKGPVLTDAVFAEWDATTAMLAEVADCVGRALHRLTCKTPETEEQREILESTGCNRFAYISVVPTGPRGGCAGLEWHAYAGVTPAGISP